MPAKRSTSQLQRRKLDSHVIPPRSITISIYQNNQRHLQATTTEILRSLNVGVQAPKTGKGEHRGEKEDNQQDEDGRIQKGPIQELEIEPACSDGCDVTRRGALEKETSKTRADTKIHSPTVF